MKRIYTAITCEQISITGVVLPLLFFSFFPSRKRKGEGRELSESTRFSSTVDILYSRDKDLLLRGEERRKISLSIFFMLLGEEGLLLRDGK